MDTGKLAMLGGTPVVDRGDRHVEWPLITADDEEAVLQTLRSGKLTTNTDGDREVTGLEDEWAQFVGTRHCVVVSNGTAALQMALAALDVGPGDEVIVPALSFIASALAPVHQLAIPVFVDVDPVTFNIDPARIEEKITDRTRAIMVVHLHGLPADMDRIQAIARAHHLAIVEDAAQAQGAMYHGRMAGALGDIAGFSLQVSKNLPTCGEGGMVTTDDPVLAERVTLLRQFGEIIRAGEERIYVSHTLGWNNKISAIQAAFTRSQLKRFTEYQTLRNQNIARFLDVLAQLPGILCPSVPPESTHAWHILRFRFDPAAAGLIDVHPGAFRTALRRVLRAEGVPMSRYQVMPLPAQRVFQTQEGFGRGYPWTIPGTHPQRYAAEDYPNTQAIIEDSLTLQKRHLNPHSGPLLERYAEAFQKVWANLDVIGRMGRALTEQMANETVPAPAVH